MDRARPRKPTLRLIPTLAHIQAHERRFGPIDGKTFRELSAALAAIHGERRYTLHTFREVMKEAILNKLHEDQSISVIAKHLQRSSMEVFKHYTAKQKT